MTPRTLFVAIGLITLLCQAAHCETTPTEGEAEDSQVSLFTTLTSGDMVRAAKDFEKGSAALESFGETLESICSKFGNKLVAISENFAAMATGFDPLGMKSAFNTIARQNETIKEQTEVIQKLQRQEIRRLRKELKRRK